ncbi:MAG TPA: molybdopterin-dependent oxidoreductase [Candidatus Bathyarchaeia archaeon]|nr:molybdopterin-dependent oxidoreductase [Candidatus Bathyarchaeia archaeon]
MIQTIRTACAHDCPDQCSLLATVEDGRLLKLQGDPEHPMTAGFACAKVNREHEWVHSPERVLTPLRRAGPKGEGRFTPITWDQALDEIVSRWRAIFASDGPLGVLGYAYSAHQGQLNRGLLLGLFHALGVTRLQAGTVCDSAAEAGWDAACGSVGGADPETVVESDLVISWGADLLTTNVHIWPLVERARARGAKLVVIEPRRSRTAERADWHLRVNVGTDAALALGVMHVLVRDGLCDRGYLARETVGFARLESEVLPRFDPARVAAITGVSPADLERLAHMYGRARAAFIRLGEGMSRCVNGGQAVRAVSLLPGVTGAYARVGGGALLMTATGFGLDPSFIRKPSGPATTRIVNHSRLGKALLELRDPPIRALFVAANNPAVTCPDSVATRRGLAREDLFTVVHDPFLSDTARYADIVLPAATYLESDDIVRSYGTYYMQFVRQVVPPQGQAWSNARLAQELGRRLGLGDPIFSMDTEGLLRELFRGARSPAVEVDLNDLREGRAVKLAPKPGQQRFTTPSGKLEFYSETLAAQGLPAMPDWMADPLSAEDGERFPLVLLTAPGYFQAHTAWAGVAALRNRAGAPECVLHPDDAAARGLRDGQAVELVSRHGSAHFQLRVSDETSRGVAFVPGQRPAGPAGEGTVNMLCSDRYSDLGEGATYQSTRLDVRAAR